MTDEAEKPITTYFTGENLYLHIHHDKDSLPNYFENSGGLDEFGDVEFNDIQFQHDFRIHRKSIQALTEVGSTLQALIPMVVYHRHVWWIYNYKLTLEDNECFSFLLRSLGPTANPEKEILRGAIGNDCPSNQKPPPITNVHITLCVKINEILETITEGELVESPSNSGYICSNLSSQLALQQLAENHEFIILHVSMDINKNYFNIEELIESSAIAPIETSMNPENHDLLKVVLTCKPSSGSDFIFTRGSGANNDATSYHVHQSILKQRSFVLDNILRQKFSLPTDQLLVIDTEDRIIFPYLTDDDMKFLLTYIYTGEIILPKFDSFARVGRVLSLLFHNQQLTNIFMQWEKLFVGNFLQLEKTNDNDAIIEECFKALLSISSAPYGAMPYAKRMAFSVLADQIAKSNETLVGKYLNQTYDKYPIGSFVQLALVLKIIIVSVKKIPL